MRAIADIFADLALATNGTQQTEDLLTEVRAFSTCPERDELRATLAIARAYVNETRIYAPTARLRASARADLDKIDAALKAKP